MLNHLFLTPKQVTFMRKILLCAFSFFVLFASNLKAQESFGQGTFALNLGVGISAWSWAYNGAGFSPAWSLSGDYGIKEDLGPGTLGVGGLIGFHSAGYKDDDYKYRWTNITFGPQVTYHPYFAQTEKLDAYVALGLLARMYSYNTNIDGIDGISNFTVWPAFRVGARYYFAEKIGVFGEVGYGASYLTAGLAIKF